MSQPIVSIIIPVYNAADYLKETLTSIQKQTYASWECICVDDGSNDESVEILTSFSISDKRFKCYKRPEELQKGGNVCRNYGFELATGKYVQWFDSDDLMHEDMIREKVAVLEQNDKLNFVVCLTAAFNGSPENAKAYDQNLSTKNLYVDFLSNKTKFFTPGPLFKRAFLSGMQLFDISLKRHQEYEFFFRVLLKCKDYGVLNKVLIYRRLHDNQVSMAADRSKLKNKLSFIAYSKNLDNYKNSSLNNKDIQAYLSKKFLKFIYRFSLQLDPSWTFNAFRCWVKAVRLR